MTNYNPGIIICTRLKSQRIPEKVMQKIGDKTLLEILIERLLPTKLPICLAYPEKEWDAFIGYGRYFDGNGNNILLYQGSENNVLERFYLAAKVYNFNPIIRITHDNILQFPEHILGALNAFKLNKNDTKNPNKSDYVSIKNGIPGTKFEIVSFDVVEKAYNIRRTCKEYLTYPFRELAGWKSEYITSNPHGVIPHLAIDYPADLQLLRIMYDQGAFDMSWFEMLEYIKANPTLMSLNHRPTVSIYTCAYNAEKTIGKAIRSVIAQRFTDWEYIIYDDDSTDDTFIQILEHRGNHEKATKTTVIRDTENKGLSKASNGAIKRTKGKYILRLDADDELLPDALETMVAEIEKDNEIGIVYSDCWQPKLATNQCTGSQIRYRYHFHDDKHENIGCALVKRAIWEEVKFNSDLAYADGLDFYLRAKEICKIAEIDVPLWIYHQRDDSMSKAGGEERERVYKEIRQCNT